MVPGSCWWRWAGGRPLSPCTAPMRFLMPCSRKPLTQNSEKSAGQVDFWQFLQPLRLATACTDALRIWAYALPATAPQPATIHCSGIAWLRVVPQQASVVLADSRARACRWVALANPTSCGMLSGKVMGRCVSFRNIYTQTHCSGCRLSRASMPMGFACKPDQLWHAEWEGDGQAVSGG